MAKRTRNTQTVNPQTASAERSASAEERKRNKLPVYTVNGQPAQIYVEDIEEGGAPPEDYNADKQRLSKRCYADIASWFAHCAYNAEQRAIEYRQRAAEARQNPEAFKRVSAGKRYRAQIAEQEQTIATQAALLQQLQERLAALEAK